MNRRQACHGGVPNIFSVIGSDSDGLLLDDFLIILDRNSFRMYLRQQSVRLRSGQ